jgi:AcrR family transcriptional regulator
MADTTRGESTGEARAGGAAPAPVNGRRAEALRNDERILEAARAVFVADPSAPIAAVAKEAGVGIGALYRRYPSKEELLRELCADGLRRYTDAVEAAVTDDGDPWASFVAFMERAVDADASSLTVRLAGTFEPTRELYEAAEHAGNLNVELFERTQKAGAIREDADVNDIAIIFEQLASIRLPGVSPEPAAAGAAAHAGRADRALAAPRPQPQVAAQPARCWCG